MLISIGIPCYRSEKYLAKTVQEIIDAFDKRPEYDYQFILVCDGSPDHTDDVIRQLCIQNDKITGVLLSRNFSQNNARMAALPYAKGDVLVYVDDDGQHSPEDIFRLADKISEGYDIVFAKFNVKREGWFRNKASDIFDGIAAKFNNRPKGIKISGFYAYSRFAIDQLLKHNNPIPSPGSYLYSMTTKVANIDTEQRRRREGTSGYNLRKLISLTLISLTNYTVVPLRIIDVIGFVSAGLGFLYGIILIIKRLFTKTYVAGYTSNMVLILILGGLILISLGLVGEYIGRVYMLLSNKPQYIVREEINIPKDAIEKKYLQAKEE